MQQQDELKPSGKHTTVDFVALHVTLPLFVPIAILGTEISILHFFSLFFILLYINHLTIIIAHLYY